MCKICTCIIHFSKQKQRNKQKQNKKKTKNKYKFIYTYIVCILYTFLSFKLFSFPVSWLFTTQ